MDEFVVAGIITLLFVVAKVLESKFIDKESKPLKTIIRDAILVYVVSAVGGIGLKQLKPMFEPAPAVIMAFTDNPPF